MLVLVSRGSNVFKLNGYKGQSIKSVTIPFLPMYPPRVSLEQLKPGGGGVQNPLPPPTKPPSPPFQLSKRFESRSIFFFSSWHGWALCFHWAVRSHFPPHTSWVLSVHASLRSSPHSWPSAFFFHLRPMQWKARNWSPLFYFSATLMVGQEMLKRMCEMQHRRAL